MRKIQFEYKVRIVCGKRANRYFTIYAANASELRLKLISALGTKEFCIMEANKTKCWEAR